MMQNDEERTQSERRESDEVATARRASILGFRYLDLRPLENDLDLFKDIFSLQEMRENQIVPLALGEGRTPFQFAITSRTPQSFITKLRQIYNDDGKNVSLALISESAFAVMLRRYDPPKEVIYDDITIASEGDSKTIQSVSETLNNVRADKLFDFLISQAQRLRASDIHIENARDAIRVRMRVDGTLHPVANLARERYRILIGELASRSGLSSAATSPQSGSIQQSIKSDTSSTKQLLNLRVEIVPTMYGMDAVLRLFSFDESLLKLDMLGLDASSKAKIEDIIKHPRGLVLVVGPTGSGKSTTLYSILNSLNSPSRKIITLEDPVEYGLTGVTQIPVKSSQGASFATGLRSVLRLDPDVVMVGEIRDVDTAKTAIQASITGHLVLATFHADTAAAAFARIIDMIGVNPVFVSALRLVVAQRLVRRLVPETKQAYSPSKEEQTWILEQLSRVPDKIKGPLLQNMKLYKPVPNTEHPFGYSGRTSVMEQLTVTDKLRELIHQQGQNLNAEKIEDLARQAGMLTMMEKAVLLALEGVTTLDEINRIL